MMGHKLFLPIFLIFFSNSLFGIQPIEFGTYLTKIRNDQKFKLNTYSKYDFNLCKHFNNKKEVNYYISCREGHFSTESDFSKLSKDIHSIEKQIYKDKFLIGLQNSMTLKLDRNLDGLNQINECLVKKIETEPCQNLKNHYVSSLRENLAKVRMLMALFNRSGHYNSPTKPNRFQKSKLKHNISNVEILDLSVDEINTLKTNTHNLEQAFKQDILDINLRKENELSDKDIKLNRIAGVAECIGRDADQLLELKRTESCKKYNAMIDFRINKKFAKQNKVYQKKYDDLISSNPLLSLMSLRGDESDEKIFASLLVTTKALRESVKKVKNRVNELEGDEREELVGFNIAVEEYLKDLGPSQLSCDMAQMIKDDLDYDNLRTDLYIAGGTIVAGGLCGASVGLTCLGSVIVSSQALTLGVSQYRYLAVKDSFYANTSNFSKAKKIESYRNLTMYLAPLALVGAAGRQFIQKAASLVKKPFKIKTGLRSPSNLKGFKSKIGVQEFSKFTTKYKTEFPGFKKIYNQIGSKLKFNFRISSINSIQVLNSSFLKTISPKDKKAIVSIFNLLNNKKELTTYMQNLYAETFHRLVKSSSPEIRRSLENGIVSNNEIVKTLLNRFKLRGETIHEVTGTSKSSFLDSIKKGPFIDRAFKDTWDGKHGSYTHLLQRDFVTAELRKTYGDNSSEFFNFLGSRDGNIFWRLLFDSVSPKGFTSPENVSKIIQTNILTPK